MGLKLSDTRVYEPRRWRRDGTLRVEPPLDAGDAQGTPTQSHISPSILLYEEKGAGDVAQSSWVMVSGGATKWCPPSTPAILGDVSTWREGEYCGLLAEVMLMHL